MFCCLPMPKAKAVLPSDAHQRSQSRRTFNDDAAQLKRLAGLGTSPLKRGLLAVITKPLRRLRADRKSHMVMSPPQRSSSVFLNLLPNEILCTVLKHVSPNDLEQCRLVNRRLRNLVDTHYVLLPQHPIEAVVSPDAACVTVTLLGAKVARSHTMKTEMINKRDTWKQRVKITRLVIYHLSPDVISVLQKLWMAGALKNVRDIENRGSNWHQIPFQLFKKVEQLKVVDLTCTSELSRLPDIFNLCPTLKKLQLLGVEPQLYEVERFLHAWTNISQPHFFDDVSLYFGCNTANESWKKYYPTFSYGHVYNADISINGVFGQHNSLNLHIGQTTETKNNSKQVEVLQNGLPVDYATLKYRQCLLTVTSPHRSRLFVNVCSSHPELLDVQPATFFLCSTQHVVVQTLPVLPLNETVYLYFEYRKPLESKFSYIHSVFLDDSEYCEVLKVPLLSH